MSDLDGDRMELIPPQEWQSSLEIWLCYGGLLFCLFGGAVAGFYLLGRQQRKLSRGSRWNLLVAALYAALLSLLPAGFSLLAFSLPGSNVSEMLALSILIQVAISSAFVGAYFKSTVAAQGHTAPLMPVEDQDLLDRVQELSQRMRVPAPGLFVLRSQSAEQTVMAYVFGLPAPFILVEDGLLTRLEPDERDAVICHELGHIANCSLWGLAALMPIALTIGIVGLWCRVSTWYLLIPATFVGLHRFWMRPMELDCDLRAARAIGFPQMASALRKIHRVSLDNHVRPGFLKLIHATCTHPSLQARLHFLRSHAPDEQRSRMPDAPQESLLLPWAMAITWLLGMGGACWLGTLSSTTASWSSAGILTVLSIAPWVILLLAARRSQWETWSKQSLKNLLVWIGLIAGVLIGVGIWHLASTSDLSDLERSALALAAVLVMSGIGVLGAFNAKDTTAERKMLQAWEQRDFEDVLRLSRRYPKHVGKSNSMRHLRAGSLAILGNRPQAITEFRELIADDPKTESHCIALASVLIDDGQPEQVLPLADQVIERFPKGMGHALAARALRRLGRLDEAQAQIEHVMAQHPDEGSAWAAAAGIAMDRGDYSRALELLQVAGEKSPGSPQEIIESARLAFRTEPSEIAISKLERALAMLRDNPMVMRQSDGALLREELAELQRAGSAACPG